MSKKSRKCHFTPTIIGAFLVMYCLKTISKLRNRRLTERDEKKLIINLTICGIFPPRLVL